MYAWETALTTRDENRVERPLEWGFDRLADFGGIEAEAAIAAGTKTPLQAMTEINAAIVREPERFFSYRKPTDYRLEQHFPQLYPTNVRPETLAQEREWRRRAESGELRKEPFLRFSSPVRTGYPENDTVNARWYEAAPRPGKPRQAIIVLPQWNADAFSHNALCELFLRWGISSLRLSKPYHDVRRPAELERSDYAVSANIGRTLQSARQAASDISACIDWLEEQGYEQFGVLGTSLGSCYAFLAASMDPRIRVCAFNHASTWFGDVVWTGQSTRHIRASFERAGINQQQARDILAGLSPMCYMQRFAEHPKRVLVVHATYDLTFIRDLSLDVLKSFKTHNVDFVSRVLPCGHYTTGETPYKFLDGYYLGHFVWQSFKKLGNEVPVRL